MRQGNSIAPSPSGEARCLHLVADSGREALDECLSQVAAGDAVLFLDAGVLHLLRLPAAALNECGAAVFFADADLKAHCLLEPARRAQIRVLDDTGFCELLAHFDHCLTWR